MKILIALTALALALGTVAFSQPLEVGKSAPAFNLKDQFGKPWKLAELQDKILVLVVADRDSGNTMGPWVDNLKSCYGAKIHLLGLLDLHSIPGIGRGFAKSRIRKETNDPLMLDFSGTISKAYLVSSKHAGVVVIDRSGTVRYIERDSFTKERLTALKAAIDKLLSTLV